MSPTGVWTVEWAQNARKWPVGTRVRVVRPPHVPVVGGEGSIGHTICVPYPPDRAKEPEVTEWLVDVVWDVRCQELMVNRTTPTTRGVELDVLVLDEPPAPPPTDLDELDEWLETT